MRIMNVGVSMNKNEFDKPIDSKSTVRMICVTDGKVINKNTEKVFFERGEGFVCNYNENVELDGGGSFVWLDFRDIDAEYGSTIFSCDNIELLGKIIKALDSEKEDLYSNIRFSEGVAEMLFSMLNFEKAEYSVEITDYVDMAKRYIDDNYCKPLKIEEIAESIGADRKYLRNLFFARMGVSTKEYLTAVRIEKAKLLLLDRTLPVSEVAISVGYSDALGFSKLFKKHVGVSPTEFRGGERITVDTREEKPAETAKKKPVKAKTEKPKPEISKKKEDIKVYLL